MGSYVVPAAVPVSATWQNHRNRNPPSNEPGTDYATAYGTDLALAESGTVSVIDTSASGGEGRRFSIDLDDGRRVSYIHLDRINAKLGQRVSRGQRGVIWSGASGNNDNWYYGPHVHVSLWERPGMSYKDTIDFQAHVGNDNVPPEPAPGPTPEEIAARKREESNMAYSIVPLTDGTVYLVSLVNGNRVHIMSPYHVTLLERVKVNNYDDTMLSGEIDIVNSYIDQLYPPPPPTEDHSTIYRLLIVIAVLLIVLVVLAATALGIDLSGWRDAGTIAAAPPLSP